MILSQIVPACLSSEAMPSKAQHGGPRLGAGRKPGPKDQLRKNRVCVMLTDGELALLLRLAKKGGLPFGTVAYQLLAKPLQRARRSLR